PARAARAQPRGHRTVRRRRAVREAARGVKPLLLALLFGMSFALAGCGGGGDDEKSAASTTTTAATTTTATISTTATTHGTFTYPAVVVDNFMQSCTAGK